MATNNALNNNLASGTGLPLTTGVTGVLPIANGGTGNSSYTAPTIQTFTTGSGTYTTPAGVKYLVVELVGGGGGGSGSGTGAPGAGGAGGNTTFGSSFLTANGGNGASVDVALGNTGGTGGTASIGVGATGLAIQGGSGGSGIVILKYQISATGAIVFNSTAEWICPEGVTSVDYLVGVGV